MVSTHQCLWALSFYSVCLGIRYPLSVSTNFKGYFLYAANFETAITNVCLAEFAACQGFLTDLLPKP